MYSALNTISEYIYFYISKNITSCTFFLVFKTVESLQCILNLKSLISSPKCFQSTNPTRIDLILKSKEDLFSNSTMRDVGISDKNHFISTMLNKKISKGSTISLYYRDYNKFEENKFAKDLTHELQNIKNRSYSQFEKAFVTVFDNHMPLKKKKLRLIIALSIRKFYEKL